MIDFNLALSKPLRQHTVLNDRYQVTCFVAEGGFGITYKAWDRVKGKSVAVKECMVPSLVHRAGDTVTVKPNSGAIDFSVALAEFELEADRLGEFDHPNIVKKLDFFRENGTAYLVLEWLQDCTLESIILEKSGADVIAQSELITYLQGVMSGLEVIHSKDYLHRDIKPSNICIREDGSAVILDFGSAMVVDDGNSTTFSSALVTDGYAPMEQYLFKSDEQGAWTDMYSLGATLYCCMTKTDPPSALSRAHYVIHEGRSPLLPGLEGLEGFSPVLTFAIEELMEVSYCDRIPCVTALREVLHLLLAPPNSQYVGGNRSNFDISEGQVWSDQLIVGGKGPALVIVPAGEFFMVRDGDDDPTTAPVHRVNIAAPFAIGIYPITEVEMEEMLADVQAGSDFFESYEICRQISAERAALSGPNSPVVDLDWHTAKRFCDWLTIQTGFRYRLPAEAEWEYAARAGSETLYPWGNRAGFRKMNVFSSRTRWSHKSPSPVGTFKANKFGLYDTAGNVREWCLDSWHPDYDDAPDDGSAWIDGGEGAGSSRVIRGGSFDCSSDESTSFFREKAPAYAEEWNIGFRVVREI